MEMDCLVCLIPSARQLILHSPTQGKKNEKKKIKKKVKNQWDQKVAYFGPKSCWSPSLANRNNCEMRVEWFKTLFRYTNSRTRSWEEKQFFLSPMKSEMKPQTFTTCRIPCLFLTPATFYPEMFYIKYWRKRAWNDCSQLTGTLFQKTSEITCVN